MSETIIRGTKALQTDPKVLKRSCQKLKIAVDLSDRDAMIASLADYFGKLHKDNKDAILNCDKCNGPSDDSLDACPYCGEKDDAPAPASAEKLAEKASETLAKQAKPRPPKKDKPEVSSEDEKEAKPEKPVKASEVKEKKLRVVKGAPAAEKPVDLATVHKAEIVSSKELDDSVAEIKSVEQNIADNHYQLGKLLEHNWKNNLHTQRLNENGKPKYKSWGAWVEAEIGYSPGYALSLISIASTFTEQQIKEVGVTKLRPICRIPDEAKRNNLLERAKGELTRSEIEKEVRQLGAKGAETDRRGNPNKGALAAETVAKRKEEKKAAAEQARKEAAEAGVTAVVQMGRVTIPLFKTSKKPGRPGRAHDIDDNPTGSEDMLNGIKVRYLLVKEPEGLSLVIERVREK